MSKRLFFYKKSQVQLRKLVYCFYLYNFYLLVLYFHKDAATDVFKLGEKFRITFKDMCSCDQRGIQLLVTMNFLVVKNRIVFNFANFSLGHKSSFIHC